MTCLVAALLGLTAAQVGLWAFGTHTPLVVVCVALTGGCVGSLGATLMHRGLQVAPGNTDIAMAAVSTAFNVGIAGGAFLGGRVVATTGVQQVPLMAATLLATALLIVLAGRCSTSPTT
ncbi:hypothetical protein N869_07460 [Cellulomonas bogoriensis 69B4 = DSM 16987]|uniref:Major facilitator superfamily (MFS) profile domain-containing protein n=1 Tax=Cellulomonas bogoriensis 69B4 = DSM 16987 TaxID=1386082 RepID=A0A0A0C0E4_9CELL|nr:hypothetical protein [Cellulomonas bogoriensis]KGM13650.1 hypothetical protein N869_07460 [Cellulomonas bogoriensis 69B4 = DSM 16987]